MNRSFVVAGAAAVLVGGCLFQPKDGCPPSTSGGNESTSGASGSNGTIVVNQSGSQGQTASESRLPGCSGSEVRVFDDESFAGASALVPRGRHDYFELEALGSPNDSIRSICVPAGCVVTIYEHGGFEGTTLSFSSDAATIPNDLAASASGMDVSCR